MLSKAICIFPGARPEFLSRQFGRSLVVWMRRIVRRHLQRRRDMAELRLMSDRELGDLGVGRGEIPALMEMPTQWRRDRPQRPQTPSKVR